MSSLFPFRYLSSACRMSYCRLLHRRRHQSLLSSLECVKYSTHSVTTDENGPDQLKNIAEQITYRKIGITRGEQVNLTKKRPDQPENPHILKVAIIGSPNAGKSTLANRLLGWKIAPVSEKVHTTRKTTLGVLTEGNRQIVFLDTPGMIEQAKIKRHGLESSLLLDPHSCLFEADLVLTLVDVSTSWGRRRLDNEVLKVLHFHGNKKAVLVLNKVDLVKPKKKLLQTTRLLTAGVVGGAKDSFTRKEVEQDLDIESLFKKMSIRESEETAREDSDVATSGDDSGVSVKDSEADIAKVNEETWRLYERRLRQIEQDLYDKDVKGWPHFDHVFMTSAKHGGGVLEMKEYLLGAAKPGCWQFSKELVTPQSVTELARQCVWEQCMNHVPKEIPYQINVKIEMWDIDEDGMLWTSFNIICSNSRQMKSILGKDGETVKKIARDAKQALLDTFRHDLAFKLYVKRKGQNKELL